VVGVGKLAGQDLRAVAQRCCDNDPGFAGFEITLQGICGVTKNTAFHL
jgi:hypothetical protein